MEQKIKHLLYCPFTGLGLYGGFRGNRWLENRIKIFKQFVVPALLSQTNQNFTLWISWRYEEKNNKQVIKLKEYLKNIGLKIFFTYSGVCFYDDKYKDEIAKERLINSLHGASGEIINETCETDYVYMTIQPSDDCYRNDAIEKIQKKFRDNPNIQAVGFKKGYIIDYQTKLLREYNPTTNPPFYTINFPRNIFIDPLKHIEYTGLKKDVGNYKKGTPIPSHEYVNDALDYKIIEDRGFLVGTHGENISTTFKHPFSGSMVSMEILNNFGLLNIMPLKIKYSFRKRILKLFPFKIQRKLRYILGEKIYNKLYEFLRS
jgi:hypothetical protein